MKGSLSILVILLIVTVTMYTGQEIRLSKANESFNIYNFTESYLIWNYTPELQNTFERNLTELAKLNITNLHASRFHNVITKAVDFIGYTMFEFAKLGVEFGYNNPQYDFEYAINIIKHILIAVIVFALVPAILPVFALVYLAGAGIVKAYRWSRNKYQIMRDNKNKKSKSD